VPTSGTSVASVIKHFVLVSYVVAFAVTPADRAAAEFHSAASQIIPVLLLVLAVEGQVFRWEMARSSLSTASREDVVRDERFQRFAAGEGPVVEAVEAVLDAAVDTARSVADTLLRQATALLLLGAMLVGEVIALRLPAHLTLTRPRRACVPSCGAGRGRPASARRPRAARWRPV
jgi:hypothetical protein